MAGAKRRSGWVSGVRRQWPNSPPPAGTPQEPFVKRYPTLTRLVSIAITPPSPPYAQRLSNGPVWVEQLADELDLEPALSTTVLPGLFDGTALPPTEGTNFAFSGALSSDVNTGLILQSQRLLRKNRAILYKVFQSR